MTLKIFRTWLFCSLILITFSSKSQISYGGNPIFKNGTQKNELKSIRLPKFEAVETSQQYKEEEEASYLKHARYAHRYSVSYNIDKSGVWEDLDDGRRVWRIAVSSPGAFSLGLEFSKFKLPRGSQLFIYNYQSSRILGAYTEESNKNSGKFSIEPLEGDEIILEYIEPARLDFEAEIEISSVLHDFKNIFNQLAGEKSSLKASGSCNVNINCPEGDAWQTEKKSVCFILYGGMIASGAMINNTNFDGRPYLLTANHVLNSQEDADIAIFHFNYEDSDCDSSDGSRSQSITGANILATTSNLDFCLVELTAMPPAAFNPYFAGWDRSGIVSSNTVCIHHPNGDVKKISWDDQAPETDSYSDSRVNYDDNTHWKILEWDLGTTEGGSSGSPLFDENHRIIGDLTGGEADCDDPVNDYYAKFSSSWANYSATNEQLKIWLDPLDSGVQILNGMDPYKGLRAAISSSNDTICYSSNVLFTDASMGDPTEFIWDFGEGAVPQSSTDQGPHSVTYSSSGEKLVKLIVRKDGIADSIFYNVLAMDLPVSNFSYTVNMNELQMINSSIQAQSYSWDFGDGNTSVDENPSHEFTRGGNHTISLTVQNLCGSEIVSKEIKTSYDDLLKIYPNPSNGLFSIDLSQIIYSKAIWYVYDTKGSQIRSGIVSTYDNLLQFNLKGMSSGVYILKLNIDEEVLQRKLLLTN